MLTFGTPPKDAPGARGVPFIGALLGLWRDPLRFLLEQARAHGDVVYLGDLGLRRAYLVSHPQDVERVLREDNPCYEKDVELRWDGHPQTGRTLPCTKTVLDEALRLEPRRWVFVRLAKHDDEIGGYRIPAGSAVMVSPHVTAARGGGERLGGQRA